ncbi:MAG: hypothetical protein ABJC89_06345 [Acidobacteriota bacterium]
MAALTIMVVGFATPVTRVRLLAAAGSALVIDAPAQPADVIVVSVAASSAGALEVADLIQQGLSPRVMVIAEPPEPVRAEFERRGLGYQDSADALIGSIHALGVPVVERIPYLSAGSEDEGEIVARWCREHSIRSVIVVTTRDHSRRLTRVLRRSTPSGSLRVTVRGSPYSMFDPSTWWHTRTGTRIAVIELQKLLLDVLRHPLS